MLSPEWLRSVTFCLDRLNEVWAWRWWACWRQVGVGGFDEVNRRVKISDGVVTNEDALAVESEVGLHQRTPVTRLSPR